MGDGGLKAREMQKEGSCCGQIMQKAVMCPWEYLFPLRAIRTDALLRARVVLSYGRISDPQNR